MGVPLTWYAAEAGEATHYEPLRGTAESDVCVIGGGFAGLWTAWHLLQAGKSVTLLEAEHIGFGASGRNGGFVSPGFARGFEVIAGRTGVETAKALHALSREGHETVRRVVRDLVPEAYMGDGWIVAARHPSRAAFEADQKLSTQTLGEPAEFWDTDRTRTVLKTERYHEVLFHPSAFHIQPLRLSRALAKDVVKRGGIIHEASPVLGYGDHGAKQEVRATHGSIRAQHIVVCTSGYDRGLCPPLSRSVLPVATHIVVTEPMQAQLDGAISTTCAISDTRRAGDYYRRLPGGRLLWGGRITTRRAPPSRLADKLKGDMLGAYPQLEGVRIGHAWSGLMGYARHKMPVIGPAGRNLWLTTAFGGHGLNTTAMGGALIAGAIASGDDRWRLFERFGAPYGAGIVGGAAVQLSYWAMQARDKLEEIRPR